jgi:methylase of polypeptide subunit release factors
MITTDINPLAAVATVITGKKNGVSIDTVQTSLVTSLLPRLHRSVDVLCFNPPYAVTPSDEIGGQGIEASWAGGIDGREVIDAMLPFVKVCIITRITAVDKSIALNHGSVHYRNFSAIKAYFTCY